VFRRLQLLQRRSKCSRRCVTCRRKCVLHSSASGTRRDTEAWRHRRPALVRAVIGGCVARYLARNFATETY